MPDAKLYRGERNRVWLKLGDTDPDGPYELAFDDGRATTTSWAIATLDVHPDGGRGIFVWASNGIAPGTPAPGTIPLTPGMYRCRARHIEGNLVDVEQIGVLEVE